MFTYTAACHFGVESVLKREIESIGLPVTSVIDGHVTFTGSAVDAFRANLWLRTAEKVMWDIASFRAESFEELYQGILNIPFEDMLEESADFRVEGRSYRSKLFSISDCQRITERALIDRLRRKYVRQYFQKTGSRYRFEISLLRDMATLSLNTSGVGLHKRGYRTAQGAAPLKETLASAILQLSYWTPLRPLLDPFTGSGTIPIEAAMLSKHIAPGLLRHFDCEHFSWMDPREMTALRREAKAAICPAGAPIYGSDYDRNMILTARANAANLGLDSDIFFFTKEVRKVDISDTYGVVVTNPPYGIRLEGEMLSRTYSNFRTLVDRLPTWSFYLITDYPQMDDVMGRPALKKRKLYNGKIRTDLYAYPGPRPPREDDV